MQNQSSIRVLVDMDKAIVIMHDAGMWLEESGKKPSKWWKPQNMNREFLLSYAEPNEFYIALVDEKPAAAMILQDNQRNQSWKSIDKNKTVKALYVHWLCVARQYAGRNLPKLMIDFASKYAKGESIELLRLDTDAKEMKLRQIYEGLGFNLMGIEKEDNRQTAFYQKEA